jgi:hypothetical protein
LADQHVELMAAHQKIERRAKHKMVAPYEASENDEK